MRIEYNGKTYSVNYRANGWAAISVYVRTSRGLNGWRRINATGRVARGVLAEAEKVDLEGQHLMDLILHEIRILREDEEAGLQHGYWHRNLVGHINYLVESL